MFSQPHLNAAGRNVKEGQRVIERHSQFPTHNEIGLIGIYRPAFFQELIASLCGVQENKTLSEHVDVDDLA